MVSLGEMHMFEAKKPFSGFVTPTYTDREAGNVDLSYQLEITVNVNIQSPAKQGKLETFLKKTMGHASWKIDSRTKTVWVHSLDGIDGPKIFNFIKKSIDKSATVRTSV